MGLRPNEVRGLYLRDFNLLLTGYFRRQEREWDRTRHIMSYVLNYAGMGANEFYTPQSILPLSIDKEGEKRMITTMHMAMELFKEFQ